MHRVLVVGVVGGLVGELHRETEVVLVLPADLAQLLELLDAGDRAEGARGVEEGLLLGGAGGVAQAEDDGVTDAPGSNVRQP